jgi:hypothetical protein
VEQVASLAIPAKGDMPVSLSDMKQVSAWRQLCVLLWRQWIAYPRNVSYTGTRLLTTLVVACCFGSIYQNKVRASPGALLWYTPHAREHALTPTIVRQPLHTLHLPLAGHGSDKLPRRAVNCRRPLQHRAVPGSQLLYDHPRLDQREPVRRGCKRGILP